MIILKQSAKTGEVKVKVNSYEDLWHLYHVISSGDFVSGKSSRSVKYGEKSEKKTFFLKVEAEKVELHETSNSLRVLGKIVEGPDEVPHNHHTFEINPKTIVTITKTKWKNYELERLKDAVKSSTKAKMLVCVFEIGEANFGILRDYGLQMLGDYAMSVPGKRSEFLKEHEKAKEDFLKELGKNLLNLAETHKVNKILLGANQFDIDSFMNANYKNEKLKEMLVTANVSTNDITGINELLRNEKIEKIIDESRIAKETKKVEKFMEELARNGLIIYGLKEVKEASDMGAVKELLITDRLIREKKEEAESIIETVERNKGEIVIVSAEHDAGRKLHHFGGIAGFLRYQIY